MIPPVNTSSTIPSNSLPNTSSLKKVLFLDRDGTIIHEPPVDFQVDSLEKLSFVPRVISSLKRISQELEYKLVMVTNQDGLGTPSFPEEAFLLPHRKMLETLRGEGVVFDDILIDRSFAHDNQPTRKPGTALLQRYIEANGVEYDIAHSFVIGDRLTDVQLAANLGCKAIYFSSEPLPASAVEEQKTTALVTSDWEEIARFLLEQQTPSRSATVRRTTNETDIDIELTLDKPANIPCQPEAEQHIHTGIGFFDHMLEQLVRHSGCSLRVRTRGDLYIDEHHTIEDTALALGEAFRLALGNKRGIERYGFFALAMDEALAHVALDCSGRNYLVWNVAFQREKVGDMPTEMVEHFFRSFSDAAKWTVNIRAEGTNDHHIIEAIFKGFARALKMAIRRDSTSNDIPSTKGVL